MYRNEIGNTWDSAVSDLTKHLKESESKFTWRAVFYKNIYQRETFRMELKIWPGKIFGLKYLHTSIQNNKIENIFNLVALAAVNKSFIVSWRVYFLINVRY